MIAKLTKPVPNRSTGQVLKMGEVVEITGEMIELGTHRKLLKALHGQDRMILLPDDVEIVNL